ncbi:unnamed protein product [Prunus brigantina]
MGVASSSSTMIKRLVSANSKKINGIQGVRDILLRSPLELPKTMIYPVRRLLRSRVWVAYADPGIKLRGLYICLAITTRLQSHEQSSGWQRELKCRLLELKCCLLDTHVEAIEASKHEIIANAYKLGYLDCRNSASPCCLLEHEDGE